VLGTVGKGFNVAVQVLNGGRLSLAAGCAQSAMSLVGEMTRYAEWRVQFGAPLASFEITQRKLSSLAADVYAADAMVGHLAAALDRKDVDASLEAAAAKVFASELVWRAADEMVQVAGGRGYVLPYPYERFLRDARINRIFEGANEVLKLFVALNGVEATAGELQELGRALRRPISEWNRVAGYAALRVRTALGGVADGVDVALHPTLEAHKKFLEKHVGQLRAAAERAALKHRKRIVERQLVVERLANMAIELYARAATIARTQRLIEERGVDAVARERALCDLFCVESGHRFRANRELLGGRADSVDDTRRAIAADVRAEGGYVVPNAILA
jgi:acyl-CoA dehydrogenase family protein 9